MRKFRRKNREAPDLEITSFLNLMIILVPFLLLSAAFSQLGVLKINLPSDEATVEQSNKKPLLIEVIVRKNQIELGDGKQLNNIFKNKADGSYDFVSLSKALIEIKADNPDKTDAQVLMESDLKYDVLVKTMDAVSLVQAVSTNGVKEMVELFPAISIGDAPGNN